MDFDEYDYLEKTVENPEGIKDDDNNGRVREDDDGKERVKSSSKHRRSDEDGHGADHHRSKRARSEDEMRERGGKFLARERVGLPPSPFFYIPSFYASPSPSLLSLSPPTL